MSKTKERLTSTKFWGMVLVSIMSLIGYFKGMISGDVAAGTIAAVVSFWITGQARVDAVAKNNGQ